MCLHINILGCVCTDLQANPHPCCLCGACDTYGHCSCRRLCAALPVTGGAASRQWDLLNIPSAGTSGVPGIRRQSPCSPALAAFFSSGRGQGLARQGQTRVAPASLGLCWQTRRIPRSEGWGSAAGWRGDALSFFYLNIVALSGQRHVRAGLFPFPPALSQP